LLAKVCSVSEIAEEGTLYRFEVENRPVLVTRLSNNLFVANSTCTHEEADLSLGILLDDLLMCPLHQAKFNVKTGRVLSGPNGDDPSTIPSLRTYTTKVENGELFIEL
jgi:nitrite reductase/ring-hydroxylating ferredoxin subunit